MAGLSLGLNDDFIQAGEFGDAAWSYTAGEPEGVKGADDAEIMRRRQRDQS